MAKNKSKMSEKVQIETDYQKILEKISKQKEERQKGLEEILRRKRELEKNEDPQIRSSKSSKDLYKTRFTLSSDKRETKVHQLHSPKSKEIQTPKVTSNNRFEEEDVLRKVNDYKFQQNRLRLIDKKARYAGIVKEIFAPTIDLQKRSEVEQRINRDNPKRTIYSKSRGNSQEKERDFVERNQPIPSKSQTNLNGWSPNIFVNSGKNTLEASNRDTKKML